MQKFAINLNILADDSHTPVKLLIRAGTSLYDLQDVKTVTVDKPTGWITFDVGRGKDG
jgi:anaphase-promoting complex subunit 10